LSAAAAAPSPCYLLCRVLPVSLPPTVHPQQARAVARHRLVVWRRPAGGAQGHQGFLHAARPPPVRSLPGLLQALVRPVEGGWGYRPHVPGATGEAFPVCVCVFWASGSSCGRDPPVAGSACGRGRLDAGQPQSVFFFPPPGPELLSYPWPRGAGHTEHGGRCRRGHTRPPALPPAAPPRRPPHPRLTSGSPPPRRAPSR